MKLPTNVQTDSNNAINHERKIANLLFLINGPKHIIFKMYIFKINTIKKLTKCSSCTHQRRVQRCELSQSPAKICGAGIWSFGERSLC